MKLSEAIRKGIKADGPQIFGSYFGLTPEGVPGTCALGAAFVGIGIGDFEALVCAGGDTAVLTQWEKYDQRCPDPCCGVGSVRSVPRLCLITHLNDDHRWTREHIADWLESEGL